MAVRPMFVANTKRCDIFVDVVDLEFKWYSGYAITQKQKSISSLHKSAFEAWHKNILEVSSKSENVLGNKLSAFNLKMKITGIDSTVTVESVFQGSKVFENGGPFIDFYGMAGKQIKRDPRLKTSGKLINFVLEGYEWPLEPKTLFYDWVYIQALNENQEIASKMLEYSCFTDIEFNPKKSFNCQARSCALYKSLHKRNLLVRCIEDKSYYQQLFSHLKKLSQLQLF